MKKAFLFLLAALTAFVTLAACQPADRQASGSDESSANSDHSTSISDSSMIDEDLPPSEEGELPTGEDLPPAPDRLVVMDTPMYRGTVTDITQVDGQWELRLEMAAGTGYGYPTMTMRTTDTTTASFDFADLKEGEYLEVFYSDQSNGLPSHIIAVNLLPSAELCVFNGELVEWNYEDGEGSMLLTSISDESATLFLFDVSTNFYLNTGDITVGDILNIYHSGALTRSIPPQGFALEVRQYTE